MKVSFLLMPLLTLITWLNQPLSDVSTAADAAIAISEEDVVMRDTVYRFFRTESDYREGDLIVRSQVEELQRYLRRTRGPIPAANPILLKRLLKDNSLLSRYYYHQGGASILRSAAKSLGGYRQIEECCTSKKGKEHLQHAIKASDPKEIVQFVNEKQSMHSTEVASDSAAADSNSPSYLDLRIYTVEDFLQAILADSQNSKSPSSHLSDEQS